MKLKKSFIFVAIFAMLVPNFVFASEIKTDEISVQRITKENQQEAVKMLAEKYGLEILSQDEVKSLGLNQSKGSDLSQSMSINEIEKYIIEIQKQLDEPIIKDYQDSDSIDNTVAPNTIAPNTVAAATATVTSRSLTTTPLTDLTLRYSVSGSYSNNSWISCGSASIVQTSGNGTNRLYRILYDDCYIDSSTVIAQKYDLEYATYVLIGQVYLKVGTGSMSGTVYHKL